VNESLRAVITQQMLQEAIDQDKAVINAKLALAQSYIDKAHGLMQEVNDQTDQTASRVRAAGVTPKVDPSAIKADAYDTTSALAKASYSLGRMLGKVAVFFAGMAVGGLVGGGNNYKPSL